MNANYADGIDTSWIWDGNFESLDFTNIPVVLTGGQRYRDITFRLRVAGAEQTTFVQRPNLEEVVTYLKTVPSKHIYVLATYTAVLQLRKLLASEGYLKGGMQ